MHGAEDFLRLGHFTSQLRITISNYNVQFHRGEVIRGFCCPSRWVSLAVFMMFLRPDSLEKIHYWMNRNIELMFMCRGV